MKLEKIKRKGVKLNLSKVKKPLIINEITLNDEVWLSEEYGEDALRTVFETMNIKELARILFRLMDNDSKKLFKAQEFESVDENGEETIEKIGGVELLTLLCIGNDDKLALISCFVDVLALSRPEVAEAIKKKAQMEMNQNQ